ncbi:hypothetical protein [Actibacterium sp. 188UL27-1]|uniref:hypothetical protein n=1 Tax=Actibacterium sp. 188UL27-1 TaxID=2786961 RepID=UPI001956BE57|nr:hypothetical protein [Actibacterium sp. 188UL27-1]MBM7069096.1 hypothetical protein [Actibacterium sp. 188UL27-1]
MTAGSDINRGIGGAFITIGATLIVFLVALISRMGMIDHPPIYDELYQLVPALSFQDGRGFAVLDGIYDRAALFTQFIALSLDLSGGRSTAGARFLPSVVPGALFVALIFVWARYVAGLVVAGIAAFLMVLWPNGIEVSQYIRFYAMQGLVFGGGAILVYTALVGEKPVWLRAAALIGAAVLFLFAAHLQMLTMLGVGGILLWIAIVLAPGWLRSEPRLWWVVASGVVAVAGILASGIFTDTILRLWQTYNWEPWPALNDTMFYHRNFRDNYPTLWPLFPVAAIIALRANFVPAAFCLILFTTTFLLQSFGGLKNIRYLYPTMPFFFVLWGIALSAVIPPIWTYMRETAPKALEPILSPAMARIAAFGVLAISILFLIAANAAFERSLRLTLGKDENQLLGKRRWQWAEAQDVLQPWIQERAVIVTTEEMRTIEWLGDYDMGFNKPRFSELLFTVGPDVRPFTVDGRTGRPIAGELADMERVIQCYPAGVILSDAPWAYSRNATILYETVNDLGGTATRQVASGMSMIGWRFSDGPVSGADCSDVPDLSTIRAADRLIAGERVAQAVSSAKADR